jgi:hypothetical protein
MDTFIFRFNAAQLRAIPSPYLGFLIASSHCCNELAILLSYIIFEHDLTRANETEATFILTRKFTIDWVLISKIVEYGNLCAKFFKGVRASSDNLLCHLAKEYEPIAADINFAKWARSLRNKISFHYDQEHAVAALGKLDDDHPMRLLVGRIKGLTLFDFAEEIVTRPIFEAAGNGDIGRGMEFTNKFIVNLVGSITAFHARATITMFKAHGMMTERVQTKLREKYCAAPGEVLVPISISSAYLKFGKVEGANKRGKAERGSKRRKAARPGA